MLTGGILTMLIGMFLLVYPAAGTVGVTLFLGWFMIAAGVIGFVTSITNRDDGGMWGGMLLGVLAVVAGVLFAFNVVAGAMTLTMLFTLWLLADGIVGIVASIARRGTGWGWWFMSSLISLVLGVMLISAWPTSSIWLIGIYAGITFVFRGMMLMFLSFEMRRLRA
jgi:uncharacterized membrane protein HdeD (DUF308 family)